MFQKFSKAMRFHRNGIFLDTYSCTRLPFNGTVVLCSCKFVNGSHWNWNAVRTEGPEFIAVLTFSVFHTCFTRIKKLLARNEPFVMRSHCAVQRPNCPNLVPGARREGGSTVFPLRRPLRRRHEDETLPLPYIHKFSLSAVEDFIRSPR